MNLSSGKNIGPIPGNVQSARGSSTIIGVETKYLTEDWLGFTISSETVEAFLSRTRHIDPLGKNEEFHTIVVESPLYSDKFTIKGLERLTEKDAGIFAR